MTEKLDEVLVEIDEKDIELLDELEEVLAGGSCKGGCIDLN